MTQLSKPLEAALAEVAALAPDQQNLIALEITQRVRALTGGQGNESRLTRPWRGRPENFQQVL
jgi:hypothetical protein